MAPLQDPYPMEVCTICFLLSKYTKKLVLYANKLNMDMISNTYKGVLWKMIKQAKLKAC
jgi:hypothetical protein